MFISRLILVLSQFATLFLLCFGCSENTTADTLDMGSVFDEGLVMDITTSPDRSLMVDQTITMDMGRVDEGGFDQATVDALQPDATVPPALDCLNEGFVGVPSLGPQYAQFNPIIGSHCGGTNHQDITGIERVVFVGDSVTVGTPPQDPLTYYRYVLALEIAERFNLEPPDWTWAQVNHH